MRTQPRWFVCALIPLIAGLYWLAVASDHGVVVWLLATVPGVVILATGAGLLLWPGDRYLTHYLGLASLVGTLGSVPLMLGTGIVEGLGLFVAAAGSFLTCGHTVLRQRALPAGVPVPVAGPRIWRKAATDEALLGFFVTCARIPVGDDVARDAQEVQALGAIRNRRGTYDLADRLVAAPAAPSAPHIRRRRAAGREFEWLTFDSGYVPDPGLPGAARWRAHRVNDRMAARVFRHPGRARPWLVCIHGYRMGVDRLDLSLFGVRYLHERLGLNLMMPILPLHGPRSIARITGGHFFDGPMVDLLHAQAQALWDIRRCLAWIRVEQPGAEVGALGYSLGGYNAALLASVESSLACVIAGIPLTDIPATIWDHMPLLHRQYIEAQGIDQGRLSALLAPVSPMYRACAVARERRYIFAATADQLVSPQQPLDLWQHWQRPAIHWYHGSHLSVRQEPGGHTFIERALRETGLIGAR
ncbi:hypothetical protein [Salinisphaera sp. T31B1]|uniref:alpha/beta hydrolase family protein n=1 Tax=Salinisphaera sp. T31B1 TaxID=727963 RepID=UPI003342C7EB